jgi:hypothetical protein
LGMEVRAEKEDGEMSGKEGAEIMPVDAGEIDWFAYYLAVSPYPTLSNPSRPPRRTVQHTDRPIDCRYCAHNHIQKLTYHLNVPHPIPIHPTPTLTSNTPEFTIARFKSASTRLYSTARAGPWERLGVGLGGVVMWDDIGWTLKWMGVSTS